MGWLAAGDLAQNLGVKFKKRECEAVCAEANLNGEKLIIARPLTYMNCSGRAVKQLLAKHRAAPEDLIVIYDDYDLPKGHVRIRPSGSAGTHNGMRSIVAELNTTSFKRVRIGIKTEELAAKEVQIVDLVLSKVDFADKAAIERCVDEAAEAILSLIAGEDVQRVEERLNRRK